VREPREDDLEAFFRIHGDPRTNVYWPEGTFKQLKQARIALDSILDEWHQYGIGYWTVTPVGSDEAIGFSGLRVKPAGPSDYFNLYYRYTPEVWGQGIARDVAARAMALAGERWPQRPVVARMRGKNIPSQRVALSVGLTRAGHDSLGRTLFCDRRLYPSFLELLR
jgi:ribosomal-protein-alanine N-acetyltransferase